MNISNFILEILKLVVNPITIIIIIIIFKKPINYLSTQIAERFKTAENVELGIFGQGLKISGIAEKLIHERQQLIEESKKNPILKKQIRDINESIRILSEPITDLIGIFLLEQPKYQSTLINIVNDIFINQFGFKIEQIKDNKMKIAIITSYKEITKRIETLCKVNLLMKKNNLLTLTKKGKTFFSEINKENNKILSFFNNKSTKNDTIK